MQTHSIAIILNLRTRMVLLFLALIQLFCLITCSFSNYLGHDDDSRWLQSFEPLVAYDVTVFENGWPEKRMNYRIPIITIGPLNQTLVVFIENRLESTSDSAPKNIVYKYSEDNGITWSKNGYIFNSTFNGNIFLGSLVTDYQTNTIFGFFTHCPLPCSKPHRIWANYVTESRDDGKTWSTPVNISGEIGTLQFDGGPSLGIQKLYEPHVGRLVVCGHIEPLEIDGVFCIHSDDHGASWNMMKEPVLGVPYNASKKDGDYLPSEATVVELPNGNLMVNARNEYHFHCHCRITLISEDGGDSFPTELVFINDDLVDEACSAGFGLFDNSTLLFTNPNSTTERVQLTLKWSKDWGRSWSDGSVIWPYDTGYSAMALPRVESSAPSPGRVYVIYERSNGQSTSINMAAVDLYGRLESL